MKRQLDCSEESVKRYKGEQRLNECLQHRAVRNDTCQPGQCRSFPVHPISRFNKSFPHLREPKEIGSFSQDIKRAFIDNPSKLRCYCPPKDPRNVSFNLRLGYDVFIKRDETIKTHIDDLLTWILLHKDVFSLHNENTTSDLPSLSTDFISWRGLYTTLLCTPYENREGWKMAVIKYKNTFYMCEYDTEEKIENRMNDTEIQKEMMYWGVKFEQYVTAEQGKLPETSKPVNNSEAFCSVVRTRLDKHSLVFGGEVDCYETVNGKKLYIELKTSREIDHPRQLTNFKRFKVLKWWAQSFMIGIKKIVCGFRDDDGVVHRLEEFSTQQLPKYCKDIANCWEPNICFNFLDEFLQHIKDVVHDDNPRAAYVFTWYPRGDIKCQYYPAQSEYSFLPDWFIDQM